MEFNWQVSAHNSKGDFVNEVFVTAREADVRHTQLYTEVDDRGLWKWRSIRQPREGLVPLCIAKTEDEYYDELAMQDSDGMACGLVA